MVRGRHDAVLFHLFNEAGSLVIADAQFALDIRGRAFAIPRDNRHRLVVKRILAVGIAAKAQHLVDVARDIHWRMDLPETEVLTRCQQGLLADSGQVNEAEARWVVRRLAELLGWDAAWGRPD